MLPAVLGRVARAATPLAAIVLITSRDLRQSHWWIWIGVGIPISLGIAAVLSTGRGREIHTSPKFAALTALCVSPFALGQLPALLLGGCEQSLRQPTSPFDDSAWWFPWCTCLSFGGFLALGSGCLMMLVPLNDAMERARHARLGWCWLLSLVGLAGLIAIQIQALDAATE